MSADLDENNRRGNLVLGVLCGMGVALVWSGWAVATRFAVTTSFGPHDVAFLRFVVPALLLWPILLRNGLGLSRIGLPRMIIMIAGAGIPFMLLASTGMRFAPASHVATLMIGVMPIFVALLSALFFGEKFARIQTTGLVTVISGIACIGGYSLFMNRASGEWRGDLLFLCCGLMFASYTIAQRRSGISAWHATALVNVVSGVLFAPVYFLVFQPNLSTAPVKELAFQFVAQGIAVSIMGMFLYAEAVRRLGAPRAAIFGALVPALAALIAIPILGEIPSSVTIAGIVMVMAGVTLVVTGGIRNVAAKA